MVQFLSRAVEWWWWFRDRKEVGGVRVSGGGSKLIQYFPRLVLSYYRAILQSLTLELWL